MPRSWFQRTARRLQQWWRRQSSSTRQLPGYLRRTVSNFASYGARQAASLAYYAVFSVFPLTLLLAVFISGLLGPVVAQQQVTLALETFLPPESAQTLEIFQTNFTQAFEQSASFGIIAIVGLAWSGLGLFSNITTSLDFIFHVPTNRSLWRQRLIAIVMAFGLVVLLATSFVTSGVLRIISTFFIERPNLWVSIGTYFLPLGLNMVILALLFRFVPARRVHWDAVWPAAIFGAIGWELAKIGFSWYLTNVANYQFIYGSIATAIVLLFWAYLLASLFLLSAEFCAQLNEWILENNWHKESDQYLQGTAVPVQPSALPPGAISPDGLPEQDGAGPASLPAGEQAGARADTLQR
jgi:membrane protein